MSDGETKILEKLNEMNQRLADVEDRVFEGAALLRETIRMMRGIDHHLRNLERPA